MALCKNRTEKDRTFSLALRFQEIADGMSKTLPSTGVLTEGEQTEWLYQGANREDTDNVLLAGAYRLTRVTIQESDTTSHPFIPDILK